MTTLYITDQTGAQHDLVYNLSGSYTFYYEPGQTGTWGWAAEKYGYNRQIGVFTPATGGTIPFNPDFTRDFSVAELTEATVGSYTTFSNLDEIYDYSAHKRVVDPMYVLASATAGTIYFNCDLVFDDAAPTIWSYNNTTDVLTLKGSLINSGSINTKIQTSGNISIGSGTTITALYSSIAGSSSSLVYPGLTNSTVYLTTNTGTVFDLQINQSGTYTQYIPPGSTGTWSWVVERYGYQRQSSSLSFAGSNYSASINYNVDLSITQATSATVAAYTSIETLDELYDYAAYMRTQEPAYVLATKNGSIVDFGATTIVIDKTASAVWAYDNATTTLTIKSNNLASGTKFSTIKSTSTITLANAAVITALYNDSTGPSARLNFSNLTNSTVYVATNTGTQYDLQTNKTGTYTDYFVSALTGSYAWVAERYGYGRLSGSFTPGTGSDFNIAASWIPDVYVTQTTQATVAAYTQIDTLDQLYDYAAYMRTQDPVHVLLTKVGTTLDFGATTIVLDKTASAVWDYNSSTTTLTIKTDVLAVGASLATIATSSTITFSNGATATCYYNESVGTADHLNFTNLINSTIYVADDVNAQFDQQLNLTGTHTTYISSHATGTWSWIAERYGFQRQSSTFGPGGITGPFAATPSWSTDIKVTAPLATVSAYTTISTLDQLYDYAAYMRTQVPTIVLAASVGTTIDFGATNLVFDSTASTIWDYNTGTNTLTVKSSSLASSTAFKLVLTTGTITFNACTVTALYTGSAGPSTRLNVTNLTNSALYISDSTGVAYDNQLGLTGTYIEYFVPGLTGAWNWAAERFGYQRQAGIFTPLTGGDLTVTALWLTDNNINETNLATVLAYTEFNNIDMLYDYTAYMRTQLPQYVLATASGTTIDFGNTNIYVDKDAVSLWSYNSTSNTLTIKSEVLNAGSKFIKLKTTGTITTAGPETFIAALYSDSVGNSSRLFYKTLKDGLTNDLDYNNGEWSETV